MNEHEQYLFALRVWKKANRIPYYASLPIRPRLKSNEKDFEYLNRLREYERLAQKWETAPKPEKFNTFDYSSEKIKIFFSDIISITTDHIRVFDYKIGSSRSNIEYFLWKNGIKYEDNKNEITLNNEYVFIFPGCAEQFTLSFFFDNYGYLTEYAFYLENEGNPYNRAMANIFDLFNTKRDLIQIKRPMYDSKNNIVQYFHGYRDVVRAYKSEYGSVSLTIMSSKEYSKQYKKWYEKNNYFWIYAIVALVALLMIYDYFAGRLSWFGLVFYPFFIFLGCVCLHSTILPLLTKFFINYKIHEHDTIGTITTFALSAVILAFTGPLFEEDESTEKSSISTALENYNVFVCTGPKSKSYHMDTNCYGLQSCSANIEEISVEEAKDEGRKPCRYCCK